MIRFVGVDRRRAGAEGLLRDRWRRVERTARWTAAMPPLSSHSTDRRSSTQIPVVPLLPSQDTTDAAMELLGDRLRAGRTARLAATGVRLTRRARQRRTGDRAQW